jgi:hypothetical protein
MMNDYYYYYYLLTPHNRKNRSGENATTKIIGAEVNYWYIVIAAEQRLLPGSNRCIAGTFYLCKQ